MRIFKTALFIMICVVFVLYAYYAHAVSLTIPAAGTTLTETEYDTNNDLVETAVSQLDAVDNTKPSVTRFTNLSTSLNSRDNAKHTRVAFTSYSTNHQSIFSGYSTRHATIDASVVTAAAFTSYSGFEVTRNATKHDKTSFTSYSTNHNTVYVNYTSEVRTYMDLHRFLQYKDNIYTDYSAVNATIPLDDTAPTVTEGRRVTYLTITPNSAGNEFHITFDAVVFMPTINKHMIAAVYANNTCVDVCVRDSSAANQYMGFAIESDYTTTGTSAVPIECRMGASDGTVFYLNGNAGSRLFGGKSAAHMGVIESE